MGKNLIFFLWHLKRLVLSNVANVKRGICHKNKSDDILWNCNFFKKTSNLLKTNLIFMPIFFCKLFRELIKVIQRNFRQFLKLRNWGWFSLIQKTRPLVGMVDIEVVIQELESAANEAVADVQNEINEKRRLEDENKKLQVSSF